MGITKDVFDILAQNQKVRDAFNKGVDALVTAATGETPTLEARKNALLGLVGSLSSISGQVSDLHGYYAALVGLCFETSEVSGRGVLVEDLYAPPNCFYFPVPASNSKLILGQRKVPPETVYGVVDSAGSFQVFYAIKGSGGQTLDFRALLEEAESGTSDQALLDRAIGSGYIVNSLVGVSVVADPPGHHYSPRHPNPFGTDTPVLIVRKAGTTRQRLEATLTNQLNAGII